MAFDAELQLKEVSGLLKHDSKVTNRHEAYKLQLDVLFRCWLFEVSMRQKFIVEMNDYVNCTPPLPMEIRVPSIVFYDIYPLDINK